jgi:uncharacterized membrane protein YeiH
MSCSSAISTLGWTTTNRSGSAFRRQRSPCASCKPSTPRLGGGIIRDILLGALPPATFADWRYLAVAAAGGVLAFSCSRGLVRLSRSIDVLDAAGLGLFAVTGAGRALELGVGPVQAIILGAGTGVGGGTLRDVLIRRLPTVLSSGLYAIPALVGAALVVRGTSVGASQVLGVPVALAGAMVCFLIRMIGLHFGVDAPTPPGTAEKSPDDEDDPTKEQPTAKQHTAGVPGATPSVQPHAPRVPRAQHA